MIRLTMAVAALIGCTADLGTRVVSPALGAASLGDGNVSIAVEARHYDDRSAPIFLPKAGPSSRLVKTDEIGTIVVDLQHGTCSYHPGPATPGQRVRASAERVQPVALANGDRHQTPTRLAVFWADGQVWAERDGTRRMVVADPDHRMSWVPASDLVVGGGKIINLVDGRSWQLDDAALVRFGDSLFAQQGDDGVLELFGHPIEWFMVYPPRPIAPMDLSTRERPHYDLGLVDLAGTTLVFRAGNLDAILIFDLAARSWREIPYRSCIPPRQPPGA